MKNAVKKISISVAMLSVAAIFFGGCSKDDGPSLVSGSFNGTVTATVDGGAGLTVNAVLAINDPELSSDAFYGNVIGTGANFNNGSFTITLPTSGLNSYLMDITDFFEYFMKDGDKGKLKVSDPNARIMDVDFIGFYYDEGEDEVYVSGIFSYTTSDKGTTCLFVYVDSDVDVTGGANVSVSLKRGWNRVYLSSKLTTQAPDDMKWYFDYFNQKKVYRESIKIRNASIS